MEGWIKIHRGLLDWEWYSDTNCVRMALHLLLMANFQTKRWRGITVERGQLVTSRSILARETGLSEREVRTAISKLEKSDFLTIRATCSYTIVTICNYEKYQSSETVDRPACGPTDDQDATNCRPGVDQPATTTEECKKVRREEYTHTVSSEKGVVGGKPAEAPAELVEAADALHVWIGERFPKIAAMAEPFTRQQLLWMFRKYDVEDVRRIVAAMDNKGAWKNRSAFCTFTSYAARDHELQTRRQAEAECGRLYTYLQMVQMLPTNGGLYRAEDFEAVQTPQGVRWRIRTLNQMVN
ncbi:hypothetical protein [uncultured Alistipes sp.]|uniref:hypothetical protein n=1 Tax=uncultured Alistipes sp. TaxID=538949 RepID=UPI00320814A0